MNRKYKPVAQIKTEHPGVKAWILITAGGASFILRPDDKEPMQQVCLLGVIE